MKLSILSAAGLALTLAAAPVLAHGDHDHAAASEVTLGDLKLIDAYARATLPSAPVGGGFLTITNDGDTDDKLIAAETAVAGHTELHEMVMDGDVMKMRELADGLPIPAHESVELAPSGYHLMFMELKEPLKEGESLDVTLTFEKAGTVTLPVAIKATNAGSGGHDHGHDHGAHDHDHGHDHDHDHGAHDHDHSNMKTE